MISFFCNRPLFKCRTSVGISPKDRQTDIDLKCTSTRITTLQYSTWKVLHLCRFKVRGNWAYISTVTYHVSEKSSLVLTPWSRILFKNLMVAHLVKTSARISWKLKVYCCVHVSPEADDILSEIKPVCAFASWHADIHFNSIPSFWS